MNGRVSEWFPLQWERRNEFGGVRSGNKGHCEAKKKQAGDTYKGKEGEVANGPMRAKVGAKTN